MTTFTTGRQAEAAAVEYLKKLGYNILEQNWRTRFCEIDIIASQNGVIYFVEVKYRQSNAYGSGLEYITPKKQKQMAFAAEFWVSENKWRGGYQLAAIEISGDQFEVTNFIDSI